MSVSNNHRNMVVCVCVCVCVFVYVCVFVCVCAFGVHSPAMGAADAESKVPSGENTELKRFPFKAWSRSVYSQTCYAYRQEFLISTLPVHPPAFFPKPLPIFPALAVANTGSCVGPLNKVGHPAGCRFPC